MNIFCLSAEKREFSYSLPSLYSLLLLFSLTFGNSEAAGLLQKLSLDSQNKSFQSSDSAKKVDFATFATLLERNLFRFILSLGFCCPICTS